MPADSSNHREEFDILVKELEQYNPELLHKQFVIGISKCDMLDEELQQAIVKDLPKQIPHVFFSSVTGQGLQALKDILWKALTEPVKQ